MLQPSYVGQNLSGSFRGLGFRVFGSGYIVSTHTTYG